MQSIHPFLWFDDNAEEAVEFYASIFKNSKITSVNRYPENAPGPAGKVMTMSFELGGQKFTALNGGPVYKFTPAISFVVSCENQEEIDEYWTRLTEGGEEVQCGWLVDKYGVSWQIVPDDIGKFFSSSDPATSQRVMEAMLPMKKLDIAALHRAYEGPVSASPA